MHMLDAWEQTAVYCPSDPTQKKIEKYAGVPGAYASFYFNRVPVGGQLKGAVQLLGATPITWRSLFWTLLIVGGGIWGAKKLGVDKKAKQVLRKIPGLSGRR
jgi:hypothetical protein